MTQVLINLVGNAIKYTPQGSVTLTSAIEVAQEAGTMPNAGATTQVRVQVTDSGLGMSAEAQKQLFQKFLPRGQSPKRENIPGTGLGLYLTKAMVERMGGAHYPAQRSRARQQLRFLLYPSPRHAKPRWPPPPQPNRPDWTPLPLRSDGASGFAIETLSIC